MDPTSLCTSFGEVGGACRARDTYPDFRLSAERVAAAITPLQDEFVQKPIESYGISAAAADVEQVAKLAKQHNIALVSDEIYSRFHTTLTLCRPLPFNDQTIVIDGFSKIMP